MRFPRENVCIHLETYLSSTELLTTRLKPLGICYHNIGTYIKFQCVLDAKYVERNKLSIAKTTKENFPLLFLNLI